MSLEEQFEMQERKRMLAEEQRRHTQLGTPMPGTVEEFLQTFKSQLDEKHLLQEFVMREHQAIKQQFTDNQRFIEGKFSEQNSEAEIAALRSELAELKDNFNLAMNKLLDEQRVHKDRVARTCDLIDREISL